MSQTVFKDLIKKLFAACNTALPDQSVLQRWFEQLRGVEDRDAPFLLAGMEQAQALPRNLAAALLELHASRPRKAPAPADHCDSPFCIHGRIFATRADPPDSRDRAAQRTLVFRCPACDACQDLGLPRLPLPELAARGYRLRPRAPEKPARKQDLPAPRPEAVNRT